MIDVGRPVLIHNLIHILIHISFQLPAIFPCLLQKESSILNHLGYSWGYYFGYDHGNNPP